MLCIKTLQYPYNNHTIKILVADKQPCKPVDPVCTNRDKWFRASTGIPPKLLTNHKCLVVPLPCWFLLLAKYISLNAKQP